MSIWTLLLLIGFVAMLAMHLRGHGGHGSHGGHGQGAHDDDGAPARSIGDGEPHSHGDPREGETGPAAGHEGHSGHRHAC